MCVVDAPWSIGPATPAHPHAATRRQAGRQAGRQACSHLFKRLERALRLAQLLLQCEQRPVLELGGTV